MGKKKTRHRHGKASDDWSDAGDIAHEATVESSGRVVYLVGDITEKSAIQVNTQLINLAQESNEPIRLVINTYGGYIDEMMSVYDTMKYIRAPVRTVGIGKIMSAGVLILAAGEKGHRVIGQNATIMIHNGYSGFVGDIWELENELQAFKYQETQWNRLFLKETSFKKAELDALLKKRLDTYLYAGDALKYGIVDKIV